LFLYLLKKLIKPLLLVLKQEKELKKTEVKIPAAEQYLKEYVMLAKEEFLLIYLKHKKTLKENSSEFFLVTLFLLDNQGFVVFFLKPLNSSLMTKLNRYSADKITLTAI